MPPYAATRFEPPPPLAFVTLQHPSTGAMEQDVPMLLDSGADITLIPQTVADSLGVAPMPDTSYQLMAFDGGTSLASAVRLDLVLQRRTFRGKFLLIDQDWGILGRNILNAMALILDGPNQSWGEWQP